MIAHVLNLYFDYYLLHVLLRLMPTFNRQNPSVLEDLFKKNINKTSKNMATIDHHHSNKMRHMLLPQSPPLNVLHHICDIQATKTVP